MGVLIYRSVADAMQPPSSARIGQRFKAEVRKYLENRKD
jgi:hypothetical protein